MLIERYSESLTRVLILVAAAALSACGDSTPGDESAVLTQTNGTMNMITAAASSSTIPVASATAAIGSNSNTLALASGGTAVPDATGNSSLSSSGTKPAGPAPAVAAPRLFSASAYESPVRADPDDLLLLPGDGLAGDDTVVYVALTDTTLPLSTPNAIPTTNSASTGVADVVSVADAPHSLTIHLPESMQPGQSYALWVADGSGHWSNGLRINDARPLWITPDFAYQTASVANLPRVLKVVGRNLQPVSSTVATQVRLSGPATYTLPIVADSLANTGAVDPVNTPQIGRYVAKVALPAGMPPGSYAVQVSRDGGKSWVTLLGENGAAPQMLKVLPDPTPAATFYVHDYGCQAGDDSNALGCVLNAIHAAQAAGGGTVVFDAGTWNLELPNTSPFTYCLYSPTATVTQAVTCDGIIVPANVSLRGAVSASAATPATIVRGQTWALAMGDGISGVPLFNLQGNNTVSNLYFADQLDYRPFDTPGFNQNELAASVLRLGVQYWHAPGGDGPGSGGYYNSFVPTTSVTHVIITGNVFDKPFIAIDNGGLPIDHLIVTNNIFGGAFSNAIYINHNDNNLWLPFRNSDSIIAFNNFYPSSFYQYTAGSYQGKSVPINTNGPVASQIGTGLRDDFSNNLADGRSTAYFYDQNISAANPKGWADAFFWNNGTNQELTLVSENQIFCAGDKANDGGAIMYDSFDLYGGLLDVAGNSAAALLVVAAGSWTDTQTAQAGSSITAQGALVDPVRSNQAMTPIPATQFYPGEWLHIIQGTGVGQWRKIVSVSVGSNSSGSTVVFNVVPALDVLPTASQPNGSVVTIGTVYWQNLTVDNVSDQSLARGCTKLNQDYRRMDSGITLPALNMGDIGWWGTAGDSVIEGNELSDSGGIALYHYFAPADPNGGQAASFTRLKSSDDVRNNIINGQYDWTSPYSAGGIWMESGATATPVYAGAWNPTDPPVTAFGIAIAGNSISQAGSTNFGSSALTPMGGITVTPGINALGPTDTSGQQAWRTASATLVFHNQLTNMAGGGLNRAGVGIGSLGMNQFETWRSVLYANKCQNVQTSVVDYGIGTKRYCPVGSSGSCECRGTPAVDVSVAASSILTQVSVGKAVTYTATVSNMSTSASALGVTLSVEPVAGVQIESMSVSSGTGICDLTVQICNLGSNTFATPGTLAPSQAIQVTMTGTAIAAGSWIETFSVTHQDFDPVVSNDSVTVGTVVQ